MTRSLVLASCALSLALAGCATVGTLRSRLVRAPDACADQTAQIYFDPASAELTPEGMAVIRAAAETARGCRVRTVEVMGLADANGAPAAALELSRRRADAVSSALAADGLPPADFRIGAAGQAGSLAEDGAKAPLRRRVDVTVRFARRS